MPEDRSTLSTAEPASQAPSYEGGPARAHLIEHLFRQHNDKLVSFLNARLRSEAEANEVAQESYVRMLELDRPGMVSFQRAYLFKIAANLAVDRLRRRFVRREANTREAFKDWLSTPGADRQVLAQDEVMQLQTALGQLPEKTQEVFRRHFLDGETLQEIAQQLHLTDRMVRYHLARSLSHCRAQLGPQELP